MYLDMLATLSRETKKQHQHLRIKGGIGASFVAYLLEATEINPLKPHYYCPYCGCVMFDNTVRDGWDLEPKSCTCKKTMVGDGHGIPFETYRPFIHRNTSFDISLAPSFMALATDIVKDYFKDCNTECDDKRNDGIVQITVISQNAAKVINLCADAEFERYRALENATATSFDRISFERDNILREFLTGNTEGIREFSSPFVRELLNKIAPQTFGDLIQIPGLSHGTGVWSDNAELLLAEGIPAAHVVAYRDDVFNYVYEHLIKNEFFDVGIAYKIAEDTRRGIYSKSGLPLETQNMLKQIGVDDYFLAAIEKIKYLFPKAHAISYVKTAIILMWYKIHYPQEFNQIML